MYRFSSKEWHQNSGLVYYLYRFYDSNLQRWINRDPLGDFGSIAYRSFIKNDEDSVSSGDIGFMDPFEKGEDPDLYCFIYNEPDNWIDADGRSVIALPAIVIAGPVEVPIGVTVG